MKTPETPQAAPARSPERALRAYVGVLVATAVAVLAASLADLGLAFAADALPLWQLGAAASLAVAVFALQRISVPFDWGGRRMTVSVDEGVVVLALAALRPTLAVPIVLLAGLAVHAPSGRRPIKVLFNVATYTTTIGAGAWLAALVAGPAVGWPPLVGALLGMAVYSGGANALVARLFATLEGGRSASIFRERLALPAGLQLALGASLGVALHALWLHHPLVALSLLPVAYLAWGYMRLAAAADRKVLVYRRLVEVGHAVTGSKDPQQAAGQVLDACGELFQTGRASLTLRGRDGEPDRAWSKEFESGAAEGLPALTVPLPDPEGRPAGELTVHPSRRHRQAYSETDRELLKIVAVHAAAALGNAAALARIHELSRLHEGIVKNAPAGICRIDGQGRILQVNAPLLAMLGVEGNVVGRDVRDLSAVRSCPDLLVRVQSVLFGHPFSDLEMGVEARGGHDRVLVVSGVPLGPAERPGAHGAVLLASDVTARREAEEASKRQMLTRPLVRRIVLSLVEDADLSRFAVAGVGRVLASEIHSDDPRQFTQAFGEMGLGELRLVSRDGDTYRFEADDLLERRRKSLQPNCHLALGFLEGTVGRLHGGEALGSELRCQSQGHKHCEFVVKAMPPATARAPVGRALRPK